MQIHSKLLINTIITLICLTCVGSISLYYTNHVANMSLLISEEVIPILKINDLKAIASDRWSALVEHSGISDHEITPKLEAEIIR
ncbi:MCP four helix bundle domain-containing protein [Candidatus Halobeggiatoa sp. HSG11]|nr:MCP four helix bundle domain-containing protein [Candidatus Halobeggiatoa sp. HSG11]